MSQPNKVGLLDHVGGGNLGDDATQQAVIQNLRMRWPKAELYGFSMNPADTESRHGIRSYPIRRNTWTLGASPETPDSWSKRLKRWVFNRCPAPFRVLRVLYATIVKGPITIYAEICFLVRSLRILESFQILIISGGGQLMESAGGPWQFPYTIFKWILMARLTRVKVMVLNVGAGPLTMPLSKYFVRTALFSADYVSFRDVKSALLVEQIGFNGHKSVFPDLVYSLRPPSRSPIRPTTSPSSPVVGIAPMPYGKLHLYPDSNPFAYASLLDALKGLGAWLIENNYRVDLFCTDIGVDPPAIADLAQKLEADSKSSGQIGLIGSKTTEDLFAEMRSLDYIVTCRFHGVVFAHLLNLPVIALCHHAKVQTLMYDIGMQEYCLDIRTIEASRLVDTFRSLVINAPQLKHRMEAMRSAYQARLTQQFDALCTETDDGPTSGLRHHWPDDTSPRSDFGRSSAH
jgi:polysaccharide pyruvyl transferase WcaK-like protein